MLFIISKSFCYMYYLFKKSAYVVVQRVNAVGTYFQKQLLLKVPEHT